MTNKILIFTDGDLDGAQSALTIKWLCPAAELTIKEVVSSAKWMAEWKSLESTFDEYDKIFILDKQPPDEMVELVDIEKVVIIDHHQSHYDVKSRYKKARALISVETSNAKWMYEIFKQTLKPTEAQKQLIWLVDDYDNYTLQSKDSMSMHIIHHTYNRPKVLKYIASWSSGFREFTDKEQNAVRLYHAEYDKQMKKIQFFKGKIKQYTVISFVGEFAINEVADAALSMFNADVCLIIYPAAQRISFRKSKECDAPLHTWAEKLAEGGGHEYSAGGKLTNTILELTKTFTLCS